MKATTSFDDGGGGVGFVQQGQAFTTNNLRGLEMEQAGIARPSDLKPPPVDHDARKRSERPPFPWWPTWSDDAVCILVASGPSAKSVLVEAGLGGAHGRPAPHVKAVAVNTSWQLVPWADYLYACDAKWWKHHKGVPEFQGIKLSQDSVATATFADVYRVILHKCDRMLRTPLGTVGSGQNSGFQALNLVAQFGLRTIALVGFDMNDLGGVHWHGKHPAPLMNPSQRLMANWRRVLDEQATVLASWGVEVFNCSPSSHLSRYARRSLKEVIRC